MKIAVFWGCRVLTEQYAYELSLRETFPQLGIELFDLREAHCCGDVLKSLNKFTAFYLASRVLALTKQIELTDLLTPCNRCHLTLTEAKYMLKRHRQIREKIEELLNDEGLEYSSNINIWHPVNFLHDHVKLEKIKTVVKRPLTGLRFATHSGCQLIRPSELGRPDNSETPQKLDVLVEALGAQVLDYKEKLDCCGFALTYSRPEAAFSLAGAKLKALQELDVDGLVTSCPDCHLMFDAKQKNAASTIGAKLELPVTYYTQLLGLAMKIPAEKLGLQLNQTPIQKILMKLNERYQASFH
jgi:heterodisulfide reductase subunit B